MAAGVTSAGDRHSGAISDGASPTHSSPGALPVPVSLGCDDPLQKELDFPAVRHGLASMEARPDHARVVEYQYVAGSEQVRQCGEGEVLDPVSGDV